MESFLVSETAGPSCSYYQIPVVQWQDSERIVNLAARLFVERTLHHLIKNVTLPTDDGNNQIDQRILSRLCVFLEKTMDMKGWGLAAVLAKGLHGHLQKSMSSMF